MDTIRAVSETLEIYISKKSDEESDVLAALEELHDLDMNLELLSSSRIGRTIRQLSKDKRSPSITAKSKQLEKKWKTLAEEKTPKKGSATKPTEKRKRENSTGSPAGQKRNASHSQKASPKTQPKKEVKKEEKEVKKEEKEVKKDEKDKKEIKPEKREEGKIPTVVADFKGETSNSARNIVQVRLWQALGACQVQGASESSKVAIAIENALYKSYEDPKTKDYSQKFRSLYSNLKDELNVGLRNALFTGDLTPERLIQMSYEELANPQLQEQRKELKEYQTEARRGDRHMRDASCTMFTCHKCGQNKTTYFQLQTRSADEPMTTFVTCCNCGNHWKF